MMDLAITLLGMGQKGLQDLWSERKKLFEEYHMEKVVKEHRPIVHSDGGKRELRKQTRYRDGKVASTTGERFLVEPKESAEFVKATSVSIRVTGGGRTH